MPLCDVNIGESLGLHRGDVVVCLLVGNGYEGLAQSLESLLEHTEAGVPLLFCDPDGRARGLIEDTLGARAAHRAETVDAALRASAPADVVILADDAIVSGDWLGSLREAAYSESRIATATTLTNDGTILSVPHRNRPSSRLPDDLTVDGAASAVREASMRLWPDIPSCLKHCVYIRRSALELVGGFDETLPSGFAADFAQRCIVRGLRHVVADDVFVFRRRVEANSEPADSAILERRYPYLAPWVAAVSQTRGGALARALSVAASALRPLTVTIDGRCLGPVVTGTQLVTLGVVGALDTYTELALRVLVPENLGDWAAHFLGPRSRVVLMRPDEIAEVSPTDIVHRPYQVVSREDVALLPALGQRLVLTQLDNIALRNPGYFHDYEAWAEYQALGRVALAASDEVVFISRHSADDAAQLGLVDPQRINVVYPATDLTSLGLNGSVTPPGGADGLESRPFMLCLGTDFLHKNRIFALRLLEALVAQGFDGTLVFAGPTVAAGSSEGEEAEYLLSRPTLRGRVRDLGTVEEPVKRWLLKRAAAVVYPTTSEGFGLTPFEAAEAGAPCLFASHSSLAEVLPSGAALLVAWDPVQSARRAIGVLRPGPAREEHVRTIREAGARFTSAANAKGLAEVYAKAVRAPAAMSLPVLDGPPALDENEAESLRRQLSAIYDDPLNRGLVGPYAVLPPELRRAVLAVATRPIMRKSALALYRTGYAMRHRRRRRPDERRPGQYPDEREEDRR